MRFDFLKKNKEKTVNERRFILSIDGGGMRGIVPAYILKKMNEELKERGINRPLYSFFDLVAGTSTGALIALGLTAPTENLGLKKEEGDDYTLHETITKGRFFKKTEVIAKGEIERLGDPEDLLSLYVENGKRIFIPDDSKGLWKLVGKVSRILGDKYDVAPLEEFYNEIYRDTKLREARVPTIAVSTNTQNCAPFVFRSWDSHGFLLREVARATSAAPTYFAPASFIDRETDEALTLLDGGIVANNPILVAYTEARKLYPNADEFIVLSLSTASPICQLKTEEYSTNLDWMGSLMGAYSSGNMNVSEMGVENIKGVKVYRIWEPVLKKKIKLDDTSPDAISSLLEAAEEIWKEDKEKILSFIEEIEKDDKVHDSLKLKPRPELEAPQPSLPSSSDSL